MIAVSLEMSDEPKFLVLQFDKGFLFELFSFIG